MIVLLCTSSVQAQITESFDTGSTTLSNWTFSGAAPTVNNPRNGDRALGFTATGQTATSPAISSPSQLSFYYRRSSNTTAWGLKVEVLNASTNAVVATLTAITSASTTYAQYTADLSSYSNIKVRLTDTRSSGAQERYVDDFSITAGATTYTVTYNGNGSTSGSAPTDSNAYASGATVTVLGNTGSLAKTGSTFNGWNTAANGSGTTYQSGNTFTISANTTLYARWATLTPSGTALTGFNYTQGSGPSASQSFNLTGSNLNTGGGTITVTGSTNYEVSSDNTTFGSTASITYTGTSLASTPVYVRLKAGLTAGSYNSETISISGGGTSSSLTASGSVSPNTPFISTSGTVNALSTTYGTASANGTFSASGSNLTTPIVITAPSGFEISTATASGFGNSVSLTPTSGTVSSTPIYVRLASTTAVGSYSGNITLASTSASTVTVAIPSSTVSAKALTITGLTGGTKVYDGNTTAAVTGTATLSGVVNGDSVTLGGSPAYTFATKAVGTGKAITVTGYSISGTGSGNYTVTQPTGLTGTVTAKSVTVTGATVTTKTYDGTTAATISGGTVVGAVSGDAVSVSTSGTFASANAGTGIAVTIALTGADATNYSLTQPGITGTINKATLSITTSDIGLTINGTYSLPGANITIPSDGTVSYSVVNGSIASLSGTTITGLAVGTTTLNISVAEGTNYFAGTASAAINVVTYPNNTYETTSNGTWPSGSATWNRLVNGVWTPASAPSASVTDLLIVKHTITSSASFSATGGVGTKVIVANGGRFEMGHSCTLSTLTIENGGTVRLNTPSVTLLSTGTVTVESGGTLISNSATFNLGDNFWNGTENFKNGSTFEIQDWDWSETTANERLVDANGTVSKNADDYYYGNIYINSGTQDKLFTLVGATGTQKLCQNNLTVNSASSTYATVMTTVNANVEIGGNLIIQQNKFSAGATTSANVTHTVKGNIEMTGGTLDLNQNNSTSGSVTLNVNGNINATAGSIISTDDGCKFVFNGTAPQTLNIANTVTVGTRVDFDVASGSEVQLTASLALPNSTNDFNVLNGGTINVQNNAITGSGVFNLNAGGTLATSNTGGIATSVTTTTRTLATGAHYVFNAATTSPFPTATFNNPGNVTTNANVTLNRTITPIGNLTVNSGTLDLSTFTINRNANGGSITLGNGTTLKINGTNGFPTNYASQVLNSSLVHFAGDAQTVNKLSVDYYDVKLSGTGAKSFDNGTVVGNNLTLDAGPSVTLPANTTITVKNQLVNNGTVEKFVIEENAALLQTNSVANSGSITVKKDSNAIYRNDYTMWSSPVTGSQTMSEFSPNTLTTRFYEYDCRNNGSGYNEVFYHVNPATATFVAGRSYLIRMPNENNGDTDYFNTRATLKFNGVFKGTANNGTVTRTLNVNGNKFTATGNPYPSPISVDAFLSANSSVLEPGTGIYLWRKKNSASTGSYATVTLAGFAANTNNGATTGGQVNAGYFPLNDASSYRISAGQGFIVKTASTATGTPQLTFTNSMRRAVATSGGQSFFRQGTSNTSRYWVNLADANGNASQMNVVYMDEATNDIDYGYDALRLEETSTLSTYTLAGDKGLTIQAKPAFNVQDVVKTGFAAPQAGTYTFAIDNKEGVFENQHIYLKDNAEGITRDLTENNYTFTTEAGTFNDRFEILYTTEALGTNNPAKEQINAVVYKSGNTVTVNTETALIKGITIYDIRGAKVYSQQGINATTASVANLNVAHQVLIVEINTNKGTVSKRIIY
ncbi:YDG domain-containing protein [Flavobacterium sp. RNTU_13]|uniref:YDG domain-containing protein n=1 Tax=Flavobacterium sp. RNTU_13 TaxID=3375145 RepID=UPI0039889B29